MERIGDLVRLGALRSPDRIAIKMRGGPSIDYRTLDGRTTRLANALLGSGLEPGQRVAAWMEDSVEYVELYVAIAKAGLVMVPVNARYKSDEATFQVHRSDSAALIFTPGVVDRLAPVLASHEFRLVATTGEPISRDVRSYEDLVQDGSTVLPQPPDEDDPFVIAFTSGTTGFPKGATLTHRSVKNICRTQSASLRLVLGGISGQIASMSFPATVMAHLIAHMYVGGCTVLMGHVDVEALLSTIEAEGITTFYLPNPMIPEFIQLVRKSPRRIDSVEGILQAGARMDPDVLRELAEVIGRRYIAGWGMTEISGGIGTATTVADLRSPDRAMNFFASVGRPVPDTVVEIVDELGRPLPHDGETVGELILCSSSVMRGYWNDPEATARSIRDGWYYSGDLGSIDPAGYTYISDRRKDLIISGGMNIYPAELELTLAKLPGVRECAVVGMPHPRWGQSPVVALVQAPGFNLTEVDVINFMVGHLASYKKPQRVLFFEELPRNTSNKLMKHLVRDMVAAQLSAEEASTRR